MDDRRERTAGLLGARRVRSSPRPAPAYALILGPPPGEREPVLMFVDEPTGDRAAADPAGRPSRRAVLARVLGGRWRGHARPRRPRRAGAHGRFLLDADAVVTAAGARVEIAGGPYALALEEAGRLEVEAAAPALARVRLASGLVSARVAGGALEIAGVPGSSVRSEGGALSVACDGEALAAGVREGRAELRRRGRDRRALRGEQPVARQRAPPSRPSAIPGSMPLHVKWPRVWKTNHGRLVLQGATAPGAVLVIAGERVPLEPDGRFTHVVALREGEQQLRAHARAVGGLEATAEGPVVVLDTRAPGARFDTRGLWKKRRRARARQLSTTDPRERAEGAGRRSVGDPALPIPRPDSPVVDVRDDLQQMSWGMLVTRSPRPCGGIPFSTAWQPRTAPSCCRRRSRQPR